MDNIIVTVQGVTRYSFTDEKSGRLVEGTNVWFTEVLAEDTENAKGFVPKKATLPIEKFTELSRLNFPYNCRIEVESKFTNRGVQTKIKNFIPDAPKKAI